MNNPRTWSLLEIMNLFDVYALTHILHGFSQVEYGLFLPKVGGQGSQPPSDLVKKKMEGALTNAELLFKVVELPECLSAVGAARRQWEKPLLDNSAGGTIVHRLQEDIIAALERRQFLRVADDRIDLLMHARGKELNGGILDLLGSKTITAFPSSEGDFIEAGNCLAAECNTAAVFHLMRAAEVGLRALATDRNAPFTNKPIDQQEWGTILQFLDGCIRDMRQEPSADWADPGMKDVQIRFYSEIVAELRQFNEAWRRHLSHAREDGIYDRDYANSVFKHVRLFMQKLGERVSENNVTSKCWV
jgi:hypothetical protein